MIRRKDIRRDVGLFCGMLFCLLLICACGEERAPESGNTKGVEATQTTNNSEGTKMTETTKATETMATTKPTETTKEKEPVFENPLSVGAAADPFVRCIDGSYYTLYTGGSQIVLHRSTTLKRAIREEKKQVFKVGKEIQGLVWAPELHYNPSTDRWYIYASGSTQGSEFSTIRMFCLESETSDPFGKYSFKGYTDPELLAIDQTVFYDEESQTLYTAYSEFTDDGQVITFAVMENPWTISEERVRLSYPKYDWEKRGAGAGKDERVNEGPIFLEHEGKLSLIYSASGCWSEYYCLGLLEYVGESFAADQMLDPENWKKYDEPIFAAANEVYGVGHCSFFSSPDGTETWIAYHGMATPDAGEANRKMYAQRIAFDEQGLPVLGEPLSRDTEIPVPSGE